jgi:hypothetical protein
MAEQLEPLPTSRAWNTDSANPANFRLVVARFPRVAFFCHTVTIPSISMRTADVPNPFSTAKFSGDHISYEPLAAVVQLDEQMSNYAEIFKWLTGAGFPDSYTQRAEMEAQFRARFNTVPRIESSEITVKIYNNLKNPSRDFSFKDAFPTNISDLEFTATDSERKHPTFTVTFAYQSFVIV